jgi:endonuclease/exonuclease/phosphatase family metal-dependent hydrolase
MSTTRPRALAVFAALALSACGPQRASVPDGSRQDASIIVVDADAGPSDAEVPPEPDAAETADADLEPATDSGEPDAESLPEQDAGDLDAGLADAAADLGDADLPDGGAGDEPDAAMPDDAALPPGEDAGPQDASVVVRVMAANLTSGNMQSYDPGEGLRLIQGVHPDVVLLQEFRYGDNSDAVLLQMVQSTLGSEFTYCRGPMVAAGDIPNGILSRWPIAGCGTWTDPEVDNRGFTWARIDVPGGRDLFAISVHLLTASASTRNLEAKALVLDIQTFVPAYALLTLGGDFNTDNMSESCYSTLAPVLISSGAQPADQQNNTGTNASRSKPYDHVLADADLHVLRIPVVIGSNTFSNGLVLDSRVYTPVSDIAPALQGDSGAPSMQHMGVIRDFLITY